MAQLGPPRLVSFLPTAPSPAPVRRRARRDASKLAPPPPAPSRRRRDKATPADPLDILPLPFPSSSSHTPRGKATEGRRRHFRGQARPTCSRRLAVLSRSCINVDYLTHREESSRGASLRRLRLRLQPRLRRDPRPIPATPPRHRARSHGYNLLVSSRSSPNCLSLLPVLVDESPKCTSTGRSH